MPKGKKRARSGPGSTTHPRNKYSDSPPDFALLASLYPSFKPYVFFSGTRPRIDWADYNATRELTRILLLHDHGVNWWIPDGQLCPTVPNRLNYIHWIDHLLSSNIIQNPGGNGGDIRGFDIGTGANCIYPLLGASLFGWGFVGSDVTDVAIEWAEKNVKSNPPHISDLIEIRQVEIHKESSLDNESRDLDTENTESGMNSYRTRPEEAELAPSSMSYCPASANKSYSGPPILVEVVRENETFDFCMCNPPFFETLEEAGLNPKTSCGGTPEEMVCEGGEKAFVTRMIEDSVVLKQRFRWYTTMLGKKVNLKILMSKLREVGATIVKTTEFVQGRTSRWGLAWSFMPPVRKIVVPSVSAKHTFSFMLEGIKRQYSAVHVLESIEEFFKSCGASCKPNSSTFSVDIVASNDQCISILKNGVRNLDSVSSREHDEIHTLDGSGSPVSSANLSFRISVFQQIPGTLLLKGSLQQKDSPLSGFFSVLFGSLEESLKSKFCQ
ncbi:PREDICTED: methyltransferase-like protein 16 [Tarenaya hassleriana]|uniref:methyltransferase-like protein 16 n=1 Tax=Tarenaya hassleriana TaxID=28532 RepID=UPI00053C91EF|nr:PREDICTED: methyltransferase-like protein 16 [Tarenaya hassleriana]